MKSLKLTQIHKKELDSRKLNLIRGGECTAGSSCHCPEPPEGGISTAASTADGWKEFNRIFQQD